MILLVQLTTEVDEQLRSRDQPGRQVYFSCSFGKINRNLIELCGPKIFRLTCLYIHYTLVNFSHAYHNQL